MIVCVLLDLELKLGDCLIQSRCLARGCRSWVAERHASPMLPTASCDVADAVPRRKGHNSRGLLDYDDSVAIQKRLLEFHRGIEDKA